MRKLHLVFIGLWLCACLGGIARADTFQLTDGRALTGEVVAGSPNEGGVQIRFEDGKYERVSWDNFSQEELKKFSQDPKLARLVQPFLEETQAARLRKSHIDIKPVPRLERPQATSLLGAMFSSSVGVVALLLLYAANLYAAYEIAVFRGRTTAVVCGVSAVLPVVGPILFLCLPTHAQQTDADDALAQAPMENPIFAVPNATAATTPAEPDQTTGLRLHTEAAQSTGPLPEAQVFQRGAFTFNRRFFETKFPGFFGVIRRDADKDMVLAIKSARGNFVGQRITRIAANDLHVQVQKGSASEEVMIPFSEIQEIVLKHKDA